MPDTHTYPFVGVVVDHVLGMVPKYVGRGLGVVLDGTRQVDGAADLHVPLGPTSDLRHSLCRRRCSSLVVDRRCFVKSLLTNVTTFLLIVIQRHCVLLLCTSYNYCFAKCCPLVLGHVSL